VVLAWLALGLLASAALLAGRSLLHSRDGLGRPRPFPVVSVVLLALLAGGLLVPVVRHHRLEQRLDAVASVLAGGPVVVHCQSAGQELVDAGAELGYVPYGRDGVPGRVTLIKHAPCASLATYLRSDKHDPSAGQVLAVHVLSHEARHLAGITSESAAECEAMQRDARAAELLGADHADALRLAQAYWRDVYPRMPDTYRSGDCVPGGPLDEHLSEPPWPSASRTAG
jgi:hypothetical protein